MVPVIDRVLDLIRRDSDAERQARATIDRVRRDRSRPYAEMRAPDRFLTYAVAQAAGIPLRVIDLNPPSSGPEMALFYGPLPDPDDPAILDAIAENLADMGITVIAQRITWARDDLR